MPHYINPDEWLPADGFKLEDNAFETVKSDKNYIVVAGPGAGKTELLAQRACYLLQTNQCRRPRKILAISFKRDAAFNLAARVEKRVGKELCQRFTSLTFDAFSKGLVDRFRNGIPKAYRPNPAYQIETSPISPSILSLFEEFDPNLHKGYFAKAKANIKSDYIKTLYNQSYPIHSSEQVKISVLEAMLKREGEEILTFPILSRLAQFLLDTNPKIVSYLQQTYSHVFLDEFQDSTALQYELLKSAFSESNNVLTAVGDTKQRIMLWAGAMDGIFDRFKEDFDAEPLSLLMNFRSAPRLVRLQNHLASNLLRSEIECLPRPGRDEGEGVAEFWIFDDHHQEAQIIAEEIRRRVIDDGIDPREICLLYKQRPDVYAEELQNQLLALGVNARVENEIQDLLVEPIIQFVLNFIFSALLKHSPIEKEQLLQEYSKFNKTYDDAEFLALESNVLKNLKKFKKEAEAATSWEVIESLIRGKIDEISFSVFSAYYPQYNERTFYDDCIDRFLTSIKADFENSLGLLACVQKFSGKGCVPIMTIHKSKGLEFSIVYFIGFEDQNFWSFRDQPEEDTCSFFVALSRAKDEVFFTFASERVNSFGNLESRSVGKIDSLYQALGSSNLVVSRDFRNNKNK